MKAMSLQTTARNGWQASGQTEDIDVVRTPPTACLSGSLRPFTLADGERITKPKEKLRYTGIPLAYYDNIIRARFPESWKFWKHDNHGGRTTYHGAPHDTTHINQTPFRDTINWSRMSAHVGHLPMPMPQTTPRWRI